MPAIWYVPISFTSPLLGVAVAPDHATYRLICGAREFCVNWVEFSYANQIGDLGGISAKLEM
jgi:flavin reductase (DIM6/NTAB) family NADH-FMN oxidoreductase RutF